MIVVSDNGPVAFLIQIGREDLLRRLYAEVLVPPAVMRELQDPGTPQAIRDWVASPPVWVREQAPVTPVDLRGSGAGEREAIQLAKEQRALLLCDDRPAVSHARREGLVVTGTLGVLQLAHERSWVDVETEIGRLRLLTTMHIPEDRLAGIVSQAQEMRRSWDLSHDLDDGFDL